MESKKRNILVITYWSYNFALIQTYTLPYVKIISKNLPKSSTIFLVTLDKIPPIIPEELSGFNIKNKSFTYYPFGLKGALMWIKIIFQLSKLIRKEKIDIIHGWCTPAAGIGYILSVLTGRKLIIDSFEPHALPMVEGNTWKRNGLAFKILFALEKLQLKRATEVICACEGMIEKSKEVYQITKQRYFFKPACVDLTLFSKEKIKNADLIKKYQLEDKITCVYAGKFGGLYLEQETFDFFKIATDYWGDKFRILILTNHSDEEIFQYLKNADISPEYVIKEFVPHSEVPIYMGLADFAFSPVKPLPSRRFSTPIKDGEYWALGLPVVITKDISDDSDIIKKYGIGSVLEELDENNYFKAIKEIDVLLKNNTRMELYNKIRPIAEKYRNFDIAEKVYAAIYGN